MSRIGKKPIQIPAGVHVSVAGGVVNVKGPKGELKLDLAPTVSAKIDQDGLVFERSGEGGKVRAMHGLMRALASNMVVGVSTGFTRKLEIQGIGYRAEVKGKSLFLNLGYSHQVEYPIPSDVQISVDKDGKILLSGAAKDRVGQVAANIRAFRRPDHYKGKGVRFEGEYIALKEGKSS